MGLKKLENLKKYVTVKSILATALSAATLVGVLYGGIAYVVAAETQEFRQVTTQSLYGLQVQILQTTKASLDFQIERLQNKENLSNGENIELETLLRERNRISQELQKTLAPKTE